jgi:hypothetical protein
MQRTPKIIGISGNARCGKDTLCQIIADELSQDCQRLAFADELKKEVDPLLQSSIGISAFTDDFDEKQIIRPLLVFWGTEFRCKLNQYVWCEKVEEQIVDPNVVYIIPDVRFKYEFQRLRERGAYTIHLEKHGIPPANEYEARNNPTLRANADMRISWGNLDEEERKLFIQRLFINKIKDYVQQ